MITSTRWLVFLFATGLALHQSVAADGRAVFQTTSPSVVLVKTYAAGHVPLKIGSGFFIEPGDALVTNAHVIAGASEVEIVKLGGETVAIKSVLAIAPDQDLVILAANGPGLKLSSRAADVGEPVFAMGNPKGLTATFSNGMVSALRNLGGISVIQITAPISPGSSGGPVLDEKGFVLGVASFGYREGQNLNFAISAENISALLAQRKALPLGLATKKAEESTKDGALAHGRDRLSVAKFENSHTRLNLALRNSEAHGVYGIQLRVLFYEDKRGPKIEALKIKIRETGAEIEKNTGTYGLIALLKAKEILDRHPTTWSHEDAVTVNVVHTSLQAGANYYLQSKNGAYQDFALGKLLSTIAEAKSYMAKRLGTNIPQLAVVEKQTTELQNKLAELKEQFEKLNQDPTSDDMLLVDYRDHNLSGGIASGLTKTFSVEGGGGIAKPIIVDYLIADK
ncbi:MAG: trypsin-like peptidase domain-containing protein [Undibacterium sp.]|nr:trypsin-like peptidase domain-containing protein [Opitutaceae bacterium]